MALKLEKTQTGIASEFYVAGELSRMGYNVTVTFGNTKSIDLIIQKGIDVFKVQVKGIQSNASICWNIDKSKISDDLFFVLVNLHVDHPAAKPEFFVLTAKDAMENFKNTIKQGEKRAYLDYRTIKRADKYQDRWHIFGQRQQAGEAINQNC